MSVDRFQDKTLVEPSRNRVGTTWNRFQNQFRWNHPGTDRSLSDGSSSVYLRGKAVYVAMDLNEIALLKFGDGVAYGFFVLADAPGDLVLGFEVTVMSEKSKNRSLRFPDWIPLERIALRGLKVARENPNAAVIDILNRKDEGFDALPIPGLDLATDERVRVAAVFP
jgi:hypothetical protein